MATIKSYTDFSQSKMLAEILPIETADMYYSDVPVREWVDKTDISKGTHVVFKSQIFAIENLPSHEIGIGECDVYAWSLSALLNILGEGYSLRNRKRKYYICMTHILHKISLFDNPVDACVDMIIGLKEADLL